MIGINRIASQDKDDLLTYANQAQLVKERFNVNVWKNYIEQVESHKNIS